MDLAPLLGAVLGLAALWLAFLALFWLLRPRDIPLRTLVSLVPDLVRMLRSVVADGSTPLDVRIVLIGLLVWIISPIDLIPEFIPVIGPFDDVVVAVIALRYVRRRLGTDELRPRWPGSDEAFALLTRVIGA